MAMTKTDAKEFTKLLGHIASLAEARSLSEVAQSLITLALKFGEHQSARIAFEQVSPWLKAQNFTLHGKTLQKINAGLPKEEQRSPNLIAASAYFAKSLEEYTNAQSAFNKKNGQNHAFMESMLSEIKETATPIADIGKKAARLMNEGDVIGAISLLTKCYKQSNSLAERPSRKQREQFLELALLIYERETENLSANENLKGIQLLRGAVHANDIPRRTRITSVSLKAIGKAMENGKFSLAANIAQEGAMVVPDRMEDFRANLAAVWGQAVQELAKQDIDKAIWQAKNLQGCKKDQEHPFARQAVLLGQAFTERKKEIMVRTQPIGIMSFEEKFNNAIQPRPA